MAGVIRVGRDGISMPRAYDGAIDVRFGEHRVWSFTTTHDTVERHGTLLAAWPAALRRRLEGVAAVTLAMHVSGEQLFSARVQFGESDEPLDLVDELGNPLTVDKGGRLQRTFDRFDAAARVQLIEETRKVLDDLNDRCGVDAYLAYGCLLGAVRDGQMIGHDSDADVAFLSRHTHPFDIIRETRRAEKKMRGLGWQVVRMSAANFKVWVPMPNGKRAGIDVFGSFHIGDHFHITGSMRGRLPREAIMPLGSVVLEGIELAAPADPERFLAYTYGPSWRVPDPAFHFHHAPENSAMMSAWWRGGRTRLAHWQRFYDSPAVEMVPEGPSDFARWVQDRIDTDSEIVELGSGTGRDALWLRSEGYRVTASDFCWKGRLMTQERASAAGAELPFRMVNLESQFSTLTHATALAHRPGTRNILARGMVDALAPGARPSLWRFCSMVCRSGGETFLEFRTPESRDEPTFFRRHPRTFARPEDVRAEIERHGGTVVDQVVGRDLAPLGSENPMICRLVVSWKR